MPPLDTGVLETALLYTELVRHTHPLGLLSTNDAVGLAVQLVPDQ